MTGRVRVLLALAAAAAAAVLVWAALASRRPAAPEVPEAPLEHGAGLERLRAEMARASRVPRPEPRRIGAAWIAAARAARRPDAATAVPPGIPGAAEVQR